MRPMKARSVVVIATCPTCVSTIGHASFAVSPNSVARLCPTRPVTSCRKVDAASLSRILSMESILPVYVGDVASSLDDGMH